MKAERRRGNVQEAEGVDVEDPNRGEDEAADEEHERVVQVLDPSGDVFIIATFVEGQPLEVDLASLGAVRNGGER